MRPIDADELIRGRAENDPVVIAVNSAATFTPEIDLPEEPILCAAMLINKKSKNKRPEISMNPRNNFYSVNELRQIAHHLLVYCEMAD